MGTAIPVRAGPSRIRSHAKDFSCQTKAQPGKKYSEAEKYFDLAQNFYGQCDANMTNMETVERNKAK
jgi:hypothetical protein